jgi:GNAT superfamily N-acetyltransferase
VPELRSVHVDYWNNPHPDTLLRLQRNGDDEQWNRITDKVSGDVDSGALQMVPIDDPKEIRPWLEAQRIAGLHLEPRRIQEFVRSARETIHERIMDLPPDERTTIFPTLTDHERPWRLGCVGFCAIDEEGHSRVMEAVPELRGAEHTICYGYGLYVAEAAAGKGLAPRIVRDVETRAQDQGYSVMVTELSPRSRALSLSMFERRLGWLRTGPYQIYTPTPHNVGIYRVLDDSPGALTTSPGQGNSPRFS